MKRGQRSPSSKERAVPDTAPTAKITAVCFDHVRASASASRSPYRIQRRSAISSMTGIAMPTAANSMWKPSEISIWTRAAVSGDM